jgi:hypothetical protein
VVDIFMSVDRVGAVRLIAENDVARHAKDVCIKLPRENIAIQTRVRKNIGCTNKNEEKIRKRKKSWVMIVLHPPNPVIWNRKGGRGIDPGVFFVGQSGLLWTSFPAVLMAESFFQRGQALKDTHIHEQETKNEKKKSPLP